MYLPKLLQRRHKIPRTLHFLHNMGHVGSRLNFRFLSSLEIRRQPLFKFVLQLFILQKVTGHNPIDFLEILEYRKPWPILLTGHVLLEVIVRVQLHRGTSAIVEGLRGRGRGTFENLVCVHLLCEVVVVAG